MYVMLEAVKNTMLSYALANGIQKIFTFVPGKNKVDDLVWKAILNQHAQAFEIHSSKFLYPFKTEFDTGTKPHLNDYSEQERLEIVANVHNTAFLEHLLHLEQERKIDFKPRPAVVAAIQAKVPVKAWKLEDLDDLGEQYRNYAIW